MGKGRVKALLTITIISLFLIIVIVSYALYKVYIPLNTFLPNTYINGIEVSKLGPTTAYKVIKGNKEISVDIKLKDSVIATITEADLGYTDYSPYYIQELVDEQRKGFGISSLFKVTDYIVKSNLIPAKNNEMSYRKFNERNEIEIYNFYSEQKLRSKIENLQLDKNKSENAQLVYDSNENKYIIIEEKYGTEIDIDLLYNLVKEAIEQLKTEVDITELVKKPEILYTDRQLNELKDRLNTWLGAGLVYDFGDRQEEIHQSIIKSWITFENNEADINIELVKDYLRAISKIYDTFGKTREFNSTTKGAIVVSGGSYGWMMHITNSANKLIEYIKEGRSGLIQPEYSYKALIRDTDDIGNTYIEISLDDQKVWLYIKGELVLETPCVTGNLSKGWGTKKGVYPILYKQRNATLKGQGYSSPVSYWMPFDTNVGLHDASWRNKFGGTIYKTNGSHGCVNLPFEAAKTIYSYAYERVPVIVY